MPPRKQKVYMVGSGILDKIKKMVTWGKNVHDKVKEGKLVSKVARAVGANGIADKAEKHGYGKRRRGRPRARK